ncbi:hypothetical protein [Pandoravirus japonicus]|uniref:Uncharacterized protein n=1 Tax=Pandoravirus japonicus TaxID=2823154 RepID=A0A811BR99_9VIRU|nr:hypothetical protein [Pandoravirus japonicus]
MGDMTTTTTAAMAMADGNAMPTAQVRKGLQLLREEWSRHGPDSPICPSDRLFNGMTLEGFSHGFVLVHHKRRYNKSALSRKAAGGPSDDAR